MTPAVLRTLRILDFLAKQGPQRLSDLARGFELPKSNVHRLLQSLIEEGFANQDVETGRYSASMKLYELGSLISARDPVMRAGSPFVQQLHQNTGETVALAILVDSDIVYIDRVLSYNPLRGSLREGVRVPAAFTAAGKVILANHSEGEALLDRIMATVDEAKQLNRSELLAEFATIQKNGYALSRSGWTRGINSIACMITASTDYPVGALALVVPSERFNEENVAKMAQQVMRASVQISESLRIR